MSVKHGLLALLERGSRYGYQLRAEFEQATGGTWPLNIGQVYTTLSRLERDGLVRALPESDGGQRPYEITEPGRMEVTLWFATPISQADRPRDELAIKLALALTTPGVDVRSVVQTQRTATVRMLQEYTRLKARTMSASPGRSTSAGADSASPGRSTSAGHDSASPGRSTSAGHDSASPGRSTSAGHSQPGDLAWRLVLDAMVFRAEAEVRWLDHCESSLVRYAPSIVDPPASAAVEAIEREDSAR